MSIRNYIAIIEDVSKSDRKSHHEFFAVEHNMSPYDMGDTQGFVDKTETKLSIGDMLRYLERNKFRKSDGPTRIMNNHIAYAFDKTSGPYTDEVIWFDTTNGKFVRNVSRRVITDKT